MESNKKILLSIVIIAVLVVTIVGVSFSFFNYTRTGSSNVIRVGRISFVSRNEQTINLSNLFPIDPEETGIMNDNTKVGTYSIDITGDTDYVDGIEYLVSATNANIYTSTGKTVPISLDVTVTNLGTPNANYFTARDSKNANIYKKIVGDTLVGDGMLLVGYIKPNTTNGTAEGVNGNITIKAYFDKNKILISDTYDGTESDNMGTTNSMAEGKTVITTTEWNALQSSGVSFKVKVEANEGIWVNGSLEEIMRKSAVMDNTTSTYVSASTGIDFGAVSSDTNGKGVYMRAGTQSDEYPIVYYRGAVDNNNVLFGGYCWNAVRTTDTGGVKLIYNNEAKNIMQGVARDDYNVTINTNNMFSYDNTTTKWTGVSTSGETVEFEFTVPAGDNYIFDVEVRTSNQCGGTLTISKNDSTIYTTSNGGGATIPYTYNAGSLSSTDKIKFTFAGLGASTSNPLKYTLQMYQSPGIILGKNCDNQGVNPQISLIENNTAVNTFKFNENTNSPANVGYMYGTAYPYSTSNWTSGAYFGNSFTWDGTSYKLVDASVTTPNATHHYSCNSTNASATCSELRYVYYVNGSTKYYITLTGGDGIEETLTKMQTNTTNSIAKTKVETWYAGNMSEFTNKIEDTIYCNDRSVRSLGGWNPNGGDLSTSEAALEYNSIQKVYMDHIPSTICPNKNDAFTWKNGNGNQKLQYPVGLITEDEIIMAGGADVNTSYYLYTGYSYWSLSPGFFNTNRVYVFAVFPNGTTGGTGVESTYGIRPVISIKPGQLITKGDGTVTNPYVIE